MNVGSFGYKIGPYCDGISFTRKLSIMGKPSISARSSAIPFCNAGLHPRKSSDAVQAWSMNSENMLISAPKSTSKRRRMPMPFDR